LKTTEETDRGTKREVQEPAKVMVLNDPYNTFNYVVDTFQRILAKDEEWCWVKAYEIHNNERAIVFEGHLERAEFICEQLLRAELGALIV
jgi:ATP-dependent Clp protease adapter protein ClpS